MAQRVPIAANLLPNREQFERNVICMNVLSLNNKSDRKL
jgi:hypothetical protein